MYDQLPNKLKLLDIFCRWKKVAEKGKLPFTAQGKLASSTDRQCFTDFETVCVNLDGYDGIGIGIFGNIVAIDMDHCVVDGMPNEMAQDIIDTMNCYTEYSPSGNISYREIPEKPATTCYTTPSQEGGENHG